LSLAPKIALGFRCHIQRGRSSQETVAIQDDETYRVSVEARGRVYHRFVLFWVMFTSSFCLQQDTQLVSAMYRSHKMLPASCKISSLYVFDALARAARQQVIKHNLSERQATGNCATFLSKVAGVLEGLFQDLLATGPPEAKVSFAGTAYGRPMRLYEVDKIPFYVPLTVGCVSLIPCPILRTWITMACFSH
jgi:hypothetical protein